MDFFIRIQSGGGNAWAGPENETHDIPELMGFYFSSDLTFRQRILLLESAMDFVHEKSRYISVTAFPKKIISEDY